MDLGVFQKTRIDVKKRCIMLMTKSRSVCEMLQLLDSYDTRNVRLSVFHEAELEPLLCYMEHCRPTV